MIHTALRAAAAFVDDNASSVAWDPHNRLSDEQRFAKGEKVRTVATELRKLADASEVRTVRYTEYATLKDRLYAFGFFLAPKLDQDVATAIHSAREPAPSREKGWLKAS